MTISGPAVPVFCMYLVAAERQGADLARARRHAADRHLQGVHRAEGVALRARAAPAADRRPDGVLRARASRRTSRCRSPATTSGRPARRPRRSWRTRWPTASATSSSGLSRGLDVNDVRARAVASSSTRTSTSSRRSRSSAPPAGSGPAGCATSTARPTERAQWLRFHTQTAGVSLTAQQPDNNVVRTAVEALAAVLGGTNSLHTNALDEVLALPSERVRADRAAHPAGASWRRPACINVADPLGGSWYVEALTDGWRPRPRRSSPGSGRRWAPDGTDRPPGILRGIEDGWFTGEIADAAFAYQRALEKGEKKIVGVNAHTGGGRRGPGDPAHLAARWRREQTARARPRRRAARDDAARPRRAGARWSRSPAATATWSRRCSTPSGPRRPSARSATRCATEWGVYTEPARF